MAVCVCICRIYIVFNLFECKQGYVYAAAEYVPSKIDISLEQAINEKSKRYRCGAPIPATPRDSVSTPEL